MSGGLHGVGVSVVNALSERLVIEVDRDGKRHRQEYAKGGKPQGKIDRRRRHAQAGPHAPAPRSRSGPIPPIFAAEGTEFVARTVLERLQTMAFLNRGLEIVFDDQREGREQTVDVPVQGRHRRLRQAPQRLQGAAVLQGRATSRTRTSDDGQMLDIAMQWNTGYYEGIHGYANGISTIEGGMHVEGFKTALTTVVNKYARAKDLLKEKDDEPHRRGHPRGHHRHRLGEARASPSSRARPRPSSATCRCARSCRRPPTRSSAEWLEENPTEANKVVKKGLAAAQARVAAKNARNATRRKSALSTAPACPTS